MGALAGILGCGLIVMTIVAWRQRSMIAILTNETKTIAAKLQAAEKQSEKRIEQIPPTPTRALAPISTNFDGVAGNLNLINAARLRGLIPPPPFISRDGTRVLTSINFMAAFGLTPDEAKVLEGVLSTAHNKVIELEAANTVTSRDEKGALIPITRATAAGATIHEGRPTGSVRQADPVRLTPVRLTPSRN